VSDSDSDPRPAQPPAAAKVASLRPPARKPITESDSDESEPAPKPVPKGAPTPAPKPVATHASKSMLRPSEPSKVMSEVVSPSLKSGEWSSGSGDDEDVFPSPQKQKSADLSSAVTGSVLSQVSKPRSSASSVASSHRSGSVTSARQKSSSGFNFGWLLGDSSESDANVA
jgi:hypothetical protein